jgi:hypothetical protein
VTEVIRRGGPPDGAGARLWIAGRAVENAVAARRPVTSLPVTQSGD